MGQKTEEKGRLTGAAAILTGGCLGFAVMTALLFAAAALLPMSGIFRDQSKLLSLLCMAVGAGTCAVHCMRRAEDRLLLRCAAGELVMLLLLASAAMLQEEPVRPILLLRDFAVQIFGCFAGFFFGGKRIVRRTKHRKYKQ